MKLDIHLREEWVKIHVMARELVVAQAAEPGVWSSNFPATYGLGFIDGKLVGAW